MAFQMLRYWGWGFSLNNKFNIREIVCISTGNHKLYLTRKEWALEMRNTCLRYGSTFSTAS